jgi:hypothetical protein
MQPRLPDEPFERLQTLGKTAGMVADAKLAPVALRLRARRAVFDSYLATWAVTPDHSRSPFNDINAVFDLAEYREEPVLTSINREILDWLVDRVESGSTEPYQDADGSRTSDLERYRYYLLGRLMWPIEKGLPIDPAWLDRTRAAFERWRTMAGRTDEIQMLRADLIAEDLDRAQTR